MAASFYFAEAIGRLVCVCVRAALDRKVVMENGKNMKDYKSLASPCSLLPSIDLNHMVKLSTSLRISPAASTMTVVSVAVLSTPNSVW